MCEGQRAAQVELSEFMGDIKLAALHEAVTLLYGRKETISQQVIQLFKTYGLLIARMFKEVHYTETTGGFGQQDEMHSNFCVV